MKDFYILTVGMIAILGLSLCGCSTLDFQKNEPKAKELAGWVKNRSGLIQNAVAAATQLAVFSFEKDSEERSKIKADLHIIGESLNVLTTGGTINPEEIRATLDIDEEYIGTILKLAASLFQANLEDFQKNGYGDVSVEIVKSITAGIRDGSTE